MLPFLPVWSISISHYQTTFLAKNTVDQGLFDFRGIWRDNNISWPGGGGPNYDLLHPGDKEALQKLLMMAGAC